MKPATTKKKMGRPRLTRDESKATEVTVLASLGTPIVDIAKMVGMSKESLTRLYPNELENGKLKADAAIRKTLFEKAVKDKNVPCLIFICKARLGMRETQVIDNISSDESMSNSTKMVIDLKDISCNELASLAKAAFRGEVNGKEENTN